MTRFEHSVVIHRPIEDVWTYVSDVANNPVWQGPIQEVRQPAGGPLEVGSEIVEVASFLGKRFEITLVLTEHDPMRRSGVRTSSGPVRLDGSYLFERVDEGTRFTAQGEVEAHGFFRLAEPLFARIAGREWAASCLVLKDLLEAEAPAASP
jgi:hypothetical protein